MIGEASQRSSHVIRLGRAQSSLQNTQVNPYVLEVEADTAEIVVSASFFIQQGTPQAADLEISSDRTSVTLTLGSDSPATPAFPPTSPPVTYDIVVILECVKEEGVA